MKKEDTEMMLRIFETERAGYAYLYPSDGGERKEDYISITAENIANYIGSHMFEAEKIVITDMCDRLTSQVSHLHHCVLANLKVYHYRPFPSSRLSTTDRLYPGFPARLLRCGLFHSMAGRKNICPIAAGVSLRPGYGS